MILEHSLAVLIEVVLQNHFIILRMGHFIARDGPVNVGQCLVAPRLGEPLLLLVDDKGGHLLQSAISRHLASGVKGRLPLVGEDALRHGVHLRFGPLAALHKICQSVSECLLSS